MKIFLCIAISFIFPGILIIVPACSPHKDRIYRESRILMNTVVTITVVAASEHAAGDAMEQAFSAIGELEERLDFHSPVSEISRINKSAGVSGVKVSSEVMELIGKALSVSEKTHGAFDITTAPVTKLYDFQNRRKPHDETLRRTLPLVSYRDVVINSAESTVYLRKPGMMIDLGGIAKGYAADRAADTLKQRGIASGIVAIAGDIKTFGRKPDGKLWKVGIRNSRATGPEDEIMATVELADAAISTSGDYERFFTSDSVRYHHILSPITGRPAGMCRSSTVIAPQGVLADSFSTAVFVLGPESGLRILEESGYGGVLVDSRGTVHITPALRGKIEFH